MTADDVLAALLNRDVRKGFYLPRYTPAGWWEMDLFCLSKAGYVTEYEIKTTRADFKADADKRRYTDAMFRRHLPVTLELAATTTKHARLEAGDPAGPKQFFFAVPDGLVEAAEVPAWAGLVAVTAPKKAGRPGRMCLKKPAPVLHRQKAAPAVAEHARSVCYYRMHNYLDKCLRLAAELRQAKAG